MKHANFGPKPTTPTLAGLTWNESYNYYRTKINGWLELEFGWAANEGFKITVAGAKLKARGTDPEHAAGIAREQAILLMKKAIETLEK